MWCVFGSDTNLHVKFDITLNQPNGFIVTSIVRSVAEKQVTARRLIVLVKKFAKCQNINSASKGTLSSIAYCFLCIYFLKKCKIPPQVEEINDLLSDEEKVEKIDDLLGKYQASTLNFEPTPSPLLCDLLYSFFRFYTQDFDFKVHAVSLSHAGLVSRFWMASYRFGGKGNPRKVVILNPYGTENMSRSVTADGIQRTEGAFKAACEILLDGRANGIFHKLPEPKQ
ncbi:Zinc finger, CCHC domain-containing protein [Orobanche minor]